MSKHERDEKIRAKEEAFIKSILHDKTMSEGDKIANLRIFNIK